MTLNNYLLAEIELLMCDCCEKCLKRTGTGPKQSVRLKGVHLRKVSTLR